MVSSIQPPPCISSISRRLTLDRASTFPFPSSFFSSSLVPSICTSSLYVNECSSISHAALFPPFSLPSHIPVLLGRWGSLSCLHSIHSNPVVTHKSKYTTRLPSNDNHCYNNKSGITWAKFQCSLSIFKHPSGGSREGLLGSLGSLGPSLAKTFKK